MRQTRSVGSLLGLAIAMGLSALAATAEAATLAEGDQVPALTLEDQHGEAGGVDASTRIVLFSRDMAGGDLLKQALADTEEGFLESRSAVYVADISGMPSLIARMFAIPSMRRRPYAMLLDRTGEATARLPDVEGRATLLLLDERRIERVVHTEDVDEIRTLLGLGGAIESP